METCGNGALKAAEPEFSIETFPHSAIIEGEEGTGKEAFADRIARALICKSKSAPCGLCSDCKKAEAGVHPDIIKLGAEQELKVDEVRELRRNAYIRPNEADVKVFIVYNCDKMNLNAQNAMLNILEEPPRGVFFLLVCENRALLLPTVLSRCAVYRMPPQELTDAEDDERVSGFIKALCSKSEFQFLSYCMTLEKLKREEFSKFLELLSKTVCEASIKRNGGQTEKLLAECFSTEGLCGLYSLLEELSDRIKFNASNAALISALLSGVSRIKRELQKNGGNVFD